MAIKKKCKMVKDNFVIKNACSKVKQFATGIKFEIAIFLLLFFY